MFYIAGVIEEISQEGVWRKARLEGSDVFEDVIVMRTYITINPVSSDSLKLKCSPSLAMDMKKGDIKHVFYDDSGVKEIYGARKYCLNKILKSKRSEISNIF